MSTELFTVVVVNFNGVRHLGPCFDALAAQSFPRHRFEIVLVDNASSDGSVGFVAGRYPWVRVLALDQNTGFTGGNNAGVRAARGRFVVLLNNDTMPDPHWLAELAAAVASNPGANVASKLVFASDPATLNSAGLQLLRDGRAIDRGFRHPDVGQFEEPAAVFAGCGAAVVFDARELNGQAFDPRYFIYYEDLDTAWRGQLGGRVTVYAPRSVVRHVLGAAGGQESWLHRFHSERNRALTSLRNADLFLAVWNSLGLAARVARSGVRWLRGRERGLMFRAQAAALGSFVVLAPRVLVERYAARTAG